MLIELVQMSIAFGLLTIGLWLYSLTKPARPRTIVRWATPVWARWASALVTLSVDVLGKRRQLPS